MLGLNGKGRGHRGAQFHGMRHGGRVNGPWGGPRGGSYGSEGRGGPGGRARRMFDGGELRLVLLKLVADEPRHGYDLIRHIEELTGGAYAPSPGVVYPTLTLLDDMGMIAAGQAEGNRKLFTVTEGGISHLAENAELVQALFARLANVGKQRERTDGAPIRRAMGNLRQVLQDRLGAADVSVDPMHDVAAIIDEATQKIERLT